MIFVEKGLYIENTEYAIKGYRCTNCNTDRIPPIKAMTGGRFGYGMITYVNNIRYNETNWSSIIV